MPYKDQQKQKEAVRKAVERHRKGITENKECNTRDVIPEVEIFEGKPRFLKLSDGQILDRANQPKSNKHLWGMVACNRASEYRNIKSRNTRLVKLLLGLDRDITGLDGKRLNLLETVRYGIGGATLKEIKTRLMRPKCQT